MLKRKRKLRKILKNLVIQKTKAKGKILITNPKRKMAEVPEEIWSSKRVKRHGRSLVPAVSSILNSWQTPGNSNKKLVSLATPSQ